MKSFRQPPTGESSSEANETNEPSTQPVETELLVANTQEEQAIMNTLIEAGFEWKEAEQLLNLREHLYENSEMRQRMDNDRRLQFVRWLYEHGEMTELSDD